MRVALLSLLVLACWSQESPWPAAVPGHAAIQPGEHPRLFLRRGDLPALKARAATPEGQAILARLRQLLDGGDGTGMPPAMRSGDGPHGDSSTPIAQPIGCLTFSHAVGYGLLWQLTGEARYADLGRRCTQLMLDGYRDRDGKARYSFRQPSGPLRAGPSLGWFAVGYDLCYDGWEPAFRATVARAIEQYAEGDGMSLENLVNGARHFPASNHWGMQVGGGALAVLALTGDPEVADQKRMDGLLAASRAAMLRNLTEGFGDGGYFAEGDGTGSMSSHIAFLPALQAWQVSQGLDFITPRPNARWTALKWIFETIPRADRLDDLRSCFPERGGYPHNIWARPDGVSGAGYFSIGYAAVTPPERAALWWFYRTHLMAHDEARGTPWDTTSLYPHHAVLAFINTPFASQPVDPDEALPHALHDSKHGFFAFRNRWQDADDILITQLTRKSPARFAHGPDRRMQVWHHGKREEWGSIPGKVDQYLVATDGSAIIVGQGVQLGIDFSLASGADALLVTSGKETGEPVTLGGSQFTIRLLGPTTPKPVAEGDAVVVGGQRITLVDGRLQFAVWRAKAAERP
jgi:hypothetical protein